VRAKPAPHACNRLGPRDPDHEAVIRFYGQGSEAAVPFSQRHIAAIAVFGLPPPWIVIGKARRDSATQLPNPVCRFLFESLV